MIYLDSCAIIKIIDDSEAHSTALTRFLREHTAFQIASSTLTLVEVRRTMSRKGAGKHLSARAEHALAKLSLISLTLDVLHHASRLPGATLRSLDAIHLASAHEVQDTLTAFISYDKRLFSAAQDSALPVVQPLDS